MGRPRTRRRPKVAAGGSTLTPAGGEEHCFCGPGRKNEPWVGKRPLEQTAGGAGDRSRAGQTACSEIYLNIAELGRTGPVRRRGRVALRFGRPPASTRSRGDAECWRRSCPIFCFRFKRSGPQSGPGVCGAFAGTIQPGGAGIRRLPAMAGGEKSPAFLSLGIFGFFIFFFFVFCGPPDPGPYGPSHPL